MVVRRNLIGWSGQSFRQSSNLLQLPQILNTTQKDPTRLEGNQPPTTNGQGGIQRGERVIWMNQDGLEKSRISGGERGVLRVGMVSEGGECGSQYPTFFLQDRENVW